MIQRTDFDSTAGTPRGLSGSRTPFGKRYRACRVWVAVALMAVLGCKTAATGAEAEAEASREKPTPREVSEGFAENRGAKLYYRTVGKGEPVFILHGGPGLDHTYLLPQMDRLADYFQLVYLDQRLCGRSDADVPPETVSFEVFVEDIEAVRELLGFDKIHLLGHSWGGLVAMHYATTHPERLETLILANSVAARAELWNRENAELAQRLTPEDAAEREAIVNSPAFKAEDPEAFASLFRLGFRRQLHDPAKVDEITLTLPADFRARSTKFSAIAPELADYDLTERLKGFPRPTLIVYGDAEASAAISGPHLASTLPDARLTVLGRSGHFPYIENAEAFFDTVREFIHEP